jgi:hypothetical protein
MSVEIGATVMVRTGAAVMVKTGATVMVRTSMLFIAWSFSWRQA